MRGMADGSVLARTLPSNLPLTSPVRFILSLSKGEAKPARAAPNGFTLRQAQDEAILRWGWASRGERVHG